jgi:ABC-2 type transport system ATP-binding protein
MNAIETNRRRKEYRTGFRRTRVTVLSQVDLAVCDGEIFGYLGPNGAGATRARYAVGGL